jgi:uncharacterized glyoxalase superfamily protein PhnB
MPDANPVTFEEATPILAVEELKSAIDYYKTVLGFELAWTWGEPAYLAGLCRERVTMHLGQQGQAGPPGPSNVYFSLRGVDAYYARLREAGAEILVPIEDRPYGMRDFAMRDPSGNTLNFGEPKGG